MKFRVMKHLEKVLEMEWMLNAPIAVPIREQEGSGDEGTTTSGCGEAERSHLGGSSERLR